MSTLFSLENVGVRFGDTGLLDGISLEIADGAFWTVVGPNGAGKTSLLRVLARLIHPTAGSVRFEGVDLGRIEQRRLARMISYVPQTVLKGVDFTVRAFVEMSRYPHLGPWTPLRAVDHEAVDQALDTTEVRHLEDRLLGTLSGGEQQRTLIAAALAQGGRVLLLDEPTSYLDYRHQVQVLELLDHLHRNLDLTLVVVTHDLNSTVGYSDSVLALKQGRLAFIGPPDELLQVDRLETIFGSEFELVARDDGRPPLVVPSWGRRSGDRR